MQKTLPIFGLFAIMFVGLIAPAMAEDGDWEKYSQIEKEYDEKRHQLDEKYHKEFEELDRYYSEQKMAIYDKLENDSSLSEEDADRMFEELYEEYDTKLEHLEEEMHMAFEELEEQFEKDMGYDRYEDDDYDAAGNYIGDKYDDDKYDDDRYYDDDKYDDDRYYDDDKYDDRHYDDDDYKYNDRYDDKHYDDEPYMDDPEWQSIEPLAQKIMDVIPMDKIEHLWEAGQIDELVELIVSETGMSAEDAKRVISFFEKYEKDYDDYDEYGYYDEHDYYEGSGELEQRIAELEEENEMLRQTIAELEEKISQLNQVLMEQVSFIYEWVLAQ